VSKAYLDKGYYNLQELDGTDLKGTFAANRLKRFYQRNHTLFPLDPESETSSEESSDDSGDSEYEEPPELTKNTIQRHSAQSPTPHLPSKLQIVPPTLSTEQKAAYQRL
jgi:hypothetical protein